MKFTFNWLKEFVAFQARPEKLAEMLTMAGLEVEVGRLLCAEPENEPRRLAIRNQRHSQSRRLSRHRRDRAMRLSALPAGG